MSAPAPHAGLLAANPPRQRCATVRGLPSRYWVYGPADAPATLLLVHGFRGEHHGLEPVAVRLPGVRVISPDLPGFGQSPAFADRPHDIASYAAWLTEFARELGIEGRAIVLGHSFGSIVASAAVASSLRTPRLILVNPIAAPALEGPSGFLSRLTELYYRAGEKLPERLGRGLLSNGLIVRFMSVTMAKTGDRELRRWIHQQHHTYFSQFASRRSVSEGFTASISHDVSMYAPHIEVPVLLIAAEKDPIAAVPAQRRLQSLFPDARLEVIDGVGHLIHYEKPAEAAAFILGFLGQDAA